MSDIGAVRYSTDDGIAKLSLVGAGMKSNPGVAADMFDALADRGHQHRDDLDVVDPDLVRDPRRGRRARGPHRAPSGSAWTKRSLEGEG